MKRKHDEASVIRSLSRKNEIKVDAITKTIEVLKNASSVGIRSWGKIDYLTNYCGYHQILVTAVSRSTKLDTTRNEFVATVNTNNKQNKQEARLDIARNTKKILKSARV